MKTGEDTCLLVYRKTNVKKKGSWGPEEIVGLLWLLWLMPPFGVFERKKTGVWFYPRRPLLSTAPSQPTTLGPVCIAAAGFIMKGVHYQSRADSVRKTQETEDVEWASHLPNWYLLGSKERRKHHCLSLRHERNPKTSSPVPWGSHADPGASSANLGSVLLSEERETRKLLTSAPARSEGNGFL